MPPFPVPNFGRGWLSAAGVGDCAVFAGGHPKTGPGSDIDVFCFAEGKSSRR